MGQRLAETRPEARVGAVAGLILPVLLTLLLAVHSTSIDTVFPGVPAIRSEFGLSPGAAQLTVGVFFLSFGVTQLFSGPIADRIGRRPVILFAMTIYSAAALISAFAPSFGWLIAARVVQGIGAAAGPSLARTVLRDVYGPTRSLAVMGYLMAAFGVMAVIAPVVGGALTAEFGWRSVFVFNASYGVLIILLCALALPETLPASQPTAAKPRLFAGFALLLRDRRFVLLSVCNSLSYGALFAWLSGGLFVLVETAGLGTDTAGACLSLSVVGFIIGSALGGRLSARLGNRQKIVFGALVCFASAATLAAFAAAGLWSVAFWVAPAFVFLFGLGFVNPTATATAIAPFPAFAGTASSLVGFIQTLAGAGSVQATGYLHDGTPLPMALVMLVLATLALATVPFLRLDHRR